MKRLIFIVITFIFATQIQAQHCLPESIFTSIKQQALQKSQIEELSFWFTDYLGSRLAASDMWLRAEQEVKAKLTDMGFKNVTSEAVTNSGFYGWDYTKCYAAMQKPYYANYACTPNAWSGSTNGLIQDTVVYLDVNWPQNLSKYDGKLTGKIVLLPSFTQYDDPHFSDAKQRLTDDDLERKSRGLLSSELSGDQATFSFDIDNIQGIDLSTCRYYVQSQKPAAIVYESGNYNVISSQSEWSFQRLPECSAEVGISAEDHGRMVRLIQHNVPVVMEIEVATKLNDNEFITNVYAEIPGKDKTLKNQTVLIGGHLDSWHGGTGANDNGAGAIVCVEALRIIKELNIQPKRTIKLALWGGEEMGLVGSTGYSDKHLADSTEAKNLTLYLNSDMGSGRFRGIYLDKYLDARPFFQTWCAPLDSLGFSTISMESEIGTDHNALNKYGVPAFAFIQDEMGYFFGYHSNMDRYERLSLEDLKVNAAILAWFAICAANDTDQIPHRERQPFFMDR